MLSKLFPERMPSTWRLGLLLAVLMAVSTALCITVAGWAMQQNLSSIARAVVLDDLGEYAVLYNRNGLKELTEVFAAGKHEESQAVRITNPAGDTIFEQTPDAVAGYNRPKRPPKKLKPSETWLMTMPHTERQQQLLVGCQILDDKNALWFGRTDAEDLAYSLREATADDSAARLSDAIYESFRLQAFDIPGAAPHPDHSRGPPSPARGEGVASRDNPLIEPR